MYDLYTTIYVKLRGVQWLGGRLLNLRSRVIGFSLNGGTVLA